ncbi:MAG TPA: cation:proton antiporter [Candidatus Limnocylindrales bacterium]|nr:cation:proton antiporter [Candidatus Limnocylindrales bacterium]
MEIDLAVLALLVAGYGLVAARLDRVSVGSALVFVAVGIVLSEDVLGLISLEPEVEPVKVLAEATLALLLFADASTIRPGSLRQDLGTILRLLVVGLLLTMALGTGIAILLFPGVPLGIALLIGASLAPTDAALGQPVVQNASVPARIRRLLNVESGLNDGIATPFVFLALALATSEVSESGGWLAGALADIAIGIVTGVVLGFVGGSLLVVADRRQWTSSVSRRLVVLALAASCYLVAVAAGGNGFIGAFVGGLAFSAGSRGRAHDDVRFTEVQGSLLAIGVWAAFGLTLAGKILSSLWDPAAIGYAVLSLTIIRMVPVAIALLGKGYDIATVLFIGWFGPRGLASVVFVIIGLVGLEEAGVPSGPLPAAIAWTVLLSVVLHGLTAGPLAAAYGRRMAALPSGVPELRAAAEPELSRTSWSEPVNGDAPAG